jgi:indole-3-glycerol phosphate synthase
VSILDDILIKTRTRVEAAQRVVPLEEIVAAARAVAPPRDFYASVKKRAASEGVAIIAEVKRRSPSAGLIRDDFDPVAIAAAYEANGAAAVSCLTEPHFFGGDLSHIDQIRTRVALPVLRKDFILSAYQIYEARAAGADAVLLILECLTESAIATLIGTAEELDLTVLLETHDPSNVRTAAEIMTRLSPRRLLLGVNNRNLRTMTTDLRHTLDVLDAIPDRSILVSESGIASPTDLDRLMRHEVRIALVGESLMRAPDPGRALASLLSR